MKSSPFRADILKMGKRYSDLSSTKEKDAHHILRKIRQTKTMDFQHTILLINGNLFAQGILAGLSDHDPAAPLGAFPAAVVAVLESPGLDIPAFRV